MITRRLGTSGQLMTKYVSAKSKRRNIGLGWKIKNLLIPGHLKARLSYELAPYASKIFGYRIVLPKLEAVLIKRDGTTINYGMVSNRVVTDAGVALMVDDFDTLTASAVNDITTFNWHGCGTGTAAEAVGNTALANELNTQLNPDGTRAQGTTSQPTAPQYRTVGTLTFDASAAVTEHGLFTVGGINSGTLWDRSVFAAINVASGDSIQFTYTLTVTSGG